MVISPENNNQYSPPATDRRHLETKIIPAISGKQHINNEERKLFALPPRLGGLGIKILPQSADRLYKNSRAITDPLIRSILEFRKQDKPLDVHEQQRHICGQVKRENNDKLRKMADETYTEVDRATQRAMEMAQEKDASVSLTTLPLQEHNFALHKGQFIEMLLHSGMAGALMEWPSNVPAE